MTAGEPGRKVRGLGYEFLVDSRVELLALALGSISHPTAAFLSRVMERGVQPGVLVRLALEHGPSPDFTPGDVSSGIVSELGGPAVCREFIARLRTFAEDTGFEGYVKRSRPIWAACTRAAWRESRGTLPVRAAERWLGVRFCRAAFIVSPLLPREFGVNAKIGGREYRVRGPNDLGGQSFEFDAFDACPAHELVHTVTNEAVIAHREELNRYRGLYRADSGCGANWEAYVIEEVVLAVTLSRSCGASPGGRPMRPASRRLRRRDTPASIGSAGLWLSLRIPGLGNWDLRHSSLESSTIIARGAESWNRRFAEGGEPSGGTGGALVIFLWRSVIMRRSRGGANDE